MAHDGRSMDALKLISDWAKWLVTIETGAIFALGSMIKLDGNAPPEAVQWLATAAIVSFVVSIAAAALLLLSLPEIAQNHSPEINVWATYDSVVGRVFNLTIQGFATVESLFFGIGVVLFAATVIAGVWSERPRRAQPVGAAPVSALPRGPLHWSSQSTVGRSGAVAIVRVLPA